MKVLFGAITLDANGIDSWIYNYYNSIVSQTFDIDFHFIVFGKKVGGGKYFKKIKQLGGKIHSVPKLSSNPVKSYFKMKSIMKKYNFDVVHVHHDYMSAFMLAAAKASGVRVRIAHAHTTELPLTAKKYPYIVSKKMIPKFATHFMAPSSVAGINMFGQKIVNSGNFFIIKNAINVMQFKYSHTNNNKIRKKYNLTNELVIGIIGRLDPVKNHDFFLDIAELDDSQSHIYIIIGDGFLQERIAKRVHHINNAILVPAVKNIDEYYSMIDILLMPSFFEGIPLTLLEAQASGLKAIISDNVNNESVISKETLILPLNSGYWKEIINSLIRPSEIVRRKRSNSSISRLIENRYDIHSESKRLVKIYSEISKNL